MRTSRSMGGERAFAVVLTAGGLLAAFRALDYEVLSDGRMGPGFMPAVFGVGLALVAAPLMWARPSAPHGAELDEHDEHDEPDSVADGAPAEPRFGLGRRVPKPMLVVVVLAIALVLGPIIGMVLALSLFMFTIGYVLERLPLRSAVVLALVGALMLHLIFERLLSISLPGPQW